MDKLIDHEKAGKVSLRLYLFGSPRIEINGSVFTGLKSRKARALLFYLAVTGKTYPREFLASLLWGESSEASMRGNLRKALQQLRNNFGQYMTITRDSVGLTDVEDHWVDVTQFDKALQNATLENADGNLVAAVKLYRGDFLNGFFVRNAPDFENWWLSERARLREKMLGSLELLAEKHFLSSDYPDAISFTRQYLKMEPWRESAHRRLMKLLALNGQRSAALAQYIACRKILAAELDVEPSSETTALYRSIRAETFLTSVEPNLPKSESASSRHNIPHSLTSPVGRRDEVKKINALLAQNRLVTLTGLGGVGKTNLSWQVGRKSADTFTHGVWLVELAPISSPEQIPQTVANALGLRESPDQSHMEQLHNFLLARHCLLILDNCEHLLEASAIFLEKLLRSCPKLKCLATSREVLGIHGEIQFRVPPLSFPEKSEQVALENWRQFDAAALFVERVFNVRPEFQVNPTNLDPIMKICRMLDGLPLALELAAAQTLVLSIEQISERLTNRFSLLKTGSPTLPPRLRALRASLDWSWQLLSAAEQHLLPQLSVFAGGLSPSAVEAICLPYEGALDSAEVLRLLTQLVNKSLVNVNHEPGQEPRFHLLESIREYGQEKLAAAGAEEELNNRHLGYFEQYGKQARHALVGPDQVTFIKTLKRELANTRKALDWARETNVPDGLAFLTDTWRFWAQEHVRECDTWLPQFLASGVEITPALKAKALSVRARFNFLSLQRVEKARQLVDESMELYIAIGDDNGIARCTLLQGLGAGPDGRRYFLESLAMFRSLEDHLGIAEALFRLGSFEWRENYAQAMAYLEECESVYREIGHLFGVMETLSAQGIIAVQNRDFNRALLRLEESQALQERIGVKGYGFTIIALGMLFYEQGNYQKARDYYEESLSISRRNGDETATSWITMRLGYVFLRMRAFSKCRKIFDYCQQMFLDPEEITGFIFATEGLASLAVQQGEATAGAHLFGWADAARLNAQDTRPSIEQDAVDKDIAAIVEMIGETAFSKAYQEGKAMSLEQILEYPVR